MLLHVSLTSVRYFIVVDIMLEMVRIHTTFQC